MKKWVPSFLAIAALVLVTSSANAAFPLRSPQVGFNSGVLQAYFNVVDPGIATVGGQLDAQVWAVAVTGNTDFTLVLKQGAGGASSIGIYNGNLASPPLYQVFPPAAVAGWYATLHFGGGNLVVSLFDQNSVFLGQTTYNGVNPNEFGFFTAGPCGLWYSQDQRNPGPQMLAWASIATVGDYWLAFAPCKYTGSNTFSDLVINIQSVKPTPVDKTTWGSVKGLYR